MVDKSLEERTKLLSKTAINEISLHYDMIMRLIRNTVRATIGF